MPALHRFVAVALSFFVESVAATLLSTTSPRPLGAMENNTSRGTRATRAMGIVPHALAADDSRLDQYQPCHCLAHSPSWQPPRRTEPKCVFIDLGAGDGGSLKTFLGGGYGPATGCPGHEWEAYLVEANPLFTPALAYLETTYQGRVHSLPSTAAYSCEANTSFYLDVENQANNYGGSSMSHKHPDVKESGQETVVPTVNFMRLLYEHTLASDHVIINMDIGGSEWDVLPCLSRSVDATLVDRLLLHQHAKSWQLGHTTALQMKQAMTALKSIGVDMPATPPQVPQ